MLGIFPTNNDYSSVDVENRWLYIATELAKEGIEIIGFSSDGAPCLITGMKLLLKFGFMQFTSGMVFLYDINGPFACIQDIIHLLNKLKIQLFDDENSFWLGNFLATGKHLFQLVEHEEFSKLDHGLTLSDVVHKDLTKDKMNFSSTEKICSWRVIKVLKTISGTEGTIEYLKVMRYIIEAFIDPCTMAHDRLKKAFYALHFFRSWKSNLEVKKTKAKNFFISKNCAESIEINSGFIARLAKQGRVNLVINCSSQPCESFFRNLRSLSSSGLTEINFTMHECMRKIEKLQIIEIYEHHLKIEGFLFPEKNLIKSDSSSSLASIIDVEVADSDTWNDDMLEIVYKESQNELSIFLQASNMVVSAYNLLEFFSYPDRSEILSNAMKKYTLKNFNITEPEIEYLILEDGFFVGSHTIFKNKRFLNEDAGNYKI